MKKSKNEPSEHEKKKDVQTPPEEEEQSVAGGITLDLGQKAACIAEKTIPLASDQTMVEEYVVDPKTGEAMPVEATEVGAHLTILDDRLAVKREVQQSPLQVPPPALPLEKRPLTAQRDSERGMSQTRPRQGLLQLGDLVNNKYRVIEFLGRGGMGEVYKVLHLDLDRMFAMKLLLSNIPDAHQRFIEEAKTAMGLVHEHAIQVRDVGTTETGVSYFTMDYSRGLTLQALIEREGIFPEARALRIVRQILSALNVLHSRKDPIVHRDLKPANVLIENRNQQDHALVLDFGIAKIVTGDAKDNTMMVGTPHYMPPEQILGGRLDHRSDHYAVGVMLYEMVTGQRPFHVCSTETLVSSRLFKKPAPRSVKPDISVGVENIITKAMANNIEERFKTTEEFIEAIDEFLNAPANSPLRVRNVKRIRLFKRIAACLILILIATPLALLLLPAEYLARADRRIAGNYLMSARERLDSAKVWVISLGKKDTTEGRQAQVPSPIAGGPLPELKQPENMVEYQAMRFYEAGKNDLPRGMRKYRTYFPMQSTRYVFYEMAGKNLLYEQREGSVSIAVRYYLPEGNLFGAEMRNTYEISRTTEEPLFVNGVGFSEPGGWKTGTYRVEAFIADRKVAEESFTIYDESEAVQIEDLRLFESDRNVPPQTERRYDTRFPCSRTRYIYFEVTIKNRLWNLAEHSVYLTAKYYRPDGSLLGEPKYEHTIPLAEERYLLKNAYGWDKPGKWQVGDHRLEVFLNHNKVREKSFTIYDDMRGFELQNARLFEGDYQPPPPLDREYTDRFGQTKTRYIYYELNFQNPMWQVCDYDIVIRAKYYGPGGALMVTRETSCSVPADQQYFSVTKRWQPPGYWLVGQYRIEIFVGDEKIAELPFTIGEDF